TPIIGPSPAARYRSFLRNASSHPSHPAARLRGSRQLMAGAGWGLAWGLALMRRDLWRGHCRLRGGIVGVPPVQGPGRVLEQGERNDQVTDPPESTEPS